MPTLKGFDSQKDNVLEKLASVGTKIILPFYTEGFVVKQNPFEKAGFNSEKIKSATGVTQAISVSK